MRAKKVIVGVAISAMLISSSIPVMAFSVTNGNKTFDKKWELSTTSDDGKGSIPTKPLLFTYPRFRNAVQQ